MPEGKVFLDDVATEVLVEGELSSLAGLLVVDFNFIALTVPVFR
jgi:hypothetical protein